MKVAIQGEAGSFSHEAAKRMVRGCSIVACARSREVFDRLERGLVGAAVIPIENSLAGSVAEHFDLLLTRNVSIQQEYRLRIVHNLIAAPGVKMKDIRDFFRTHPKIEAMPFYDTAGSVKQVVENRLKDAAGIAGRQAAAVYKGRILAAGIEDDKRNFTRFFLIRKGRHIVSGANKTSIAFRAKNVPGALFKALSVFALRDISLSKIESRPMRGRPWEYVFYADLLCGDDKVGRNALRHLAESASPVKVLGVYRSA
jgi:prephenate dehydratase